MPGTDAFPQDELVTDVTQFSQDEVAELNTSSDALKRKVASFFDGQVKSFITPAYLTKLMASLASTPGAKEAIEHLQDWVINGTGLDPAIIAKSSQVVTAIFSFLPVPGVGLVCTALGSLFTTLVKSTHVTPDHLAVIEDTREFFRLLQEVEAEFTNSHKRSVRSSRLIDAAAVASAAAIMEAVEPPADQDAATAARSSANGEPADVLDDQATPSSVIQETLARNAKRVSLQAKPAESQHVSVASARHNLAEILEDLMRQYSNEIENVHQALRDWDKLKGPTRFWRTFRGMQPNAAGPRARMETIRSRIKDRVQFRVAIKVESIDVTTKKIDETAMRIRDVTEQTRLILQGELQQYKSQKDELLLITHDLEMQRSNLEMVNLTLKNEAKELDEENQRLVQIKTKLEKERVGLRIMQGMLRQGNINLLVKQQRLVRDIAENEQKLKAEQAFRLELELKEWSDTLGELFIEAINDGRGSGIFPLHLSDVDIMREIATKPLHYAATKPEFLDHLLDFPPIFSQYLRSPMRKSDKVLQYSWLLRSKISEKLGLQTPVEIARHFGNVDFVRLFSVPDASEEPVASFDKPVLTGETSAELALFRALLEDWRENEVRVLVSTFSTEIRQVLASHYRLQLETAAKAVVNKIVHGPSEPLSSTKFDVYGAFALRVTAINDKTRVLVDDAKAAAINGHGPIFNLKAVSTAAGLKNNFQRITGKQMQNSTLFVTAAGDVRRTVGGLEPAVSPMHSADSQLEAIRAYVATKKTHRTYFWLVLNRSQLVDASRMQASRFTVNGSTIIPVLREQVDRADVAQSTVAVAAANAFFMDSKHPAMAASKKPKFRWLATEVGVRVLLRLFEFRDDMIDRAISLISAPLPEFHDRYPDFKSLESLPPFQAAARWGNLSDIRAELTALIAHLADYVATGYADDTATVRFNFFVPKSFSGDAAMTAIEIAQLYRNYDVFHFLVDETTRRRDMFVPLLVSDADFERLVATSAGISAADKHASVERSNSKHTPAVLEHMTRSASPNPDRDDDDDDVLDHEAEAAQAARRAELRNIRRRMTDTSATFSATSATSLNEQAHGSSASLGQAPVGGHEDEDEYADEHVDDAAHDDDDENNGHEEEEDE